MTASPVDPLFVELQSAVLGRYSLERELGRGGMGIVYLARDVALDRLIAIKLLPPGLAARPALRARFLREARTAARLSHPNIVPIHAVEEAGRLVWFVMAYVPGESLGARLRDRGGLPLGEVCRILRDAAWALGHAHAQGVVHRDVKPDNILLESGGRRALLADFGIAAPAQGEAGGEDAVFGTVAYLSPEQARGDAVDGRSDLYALGVVGYCALSGKLPYPVATLGELVERQLAGTPPPLAQAAPHIPRALTRTIDRCLAGYASARFQTGEELAEALEQLQSGPSELPAPLRVWLTQGKQRARPATFLSLAWGIPTTIGGIALWISNPVQPGFLFVTLFGLVALSAPWGIYTLARMFHTRRLLKAGYSHHDIVAALDRYVELRREELAFEHGTQSTALGRVANRALGTLVGLSIGGLFATIVLPVPMREAVGMATLMTAVTTVVLFWARNFIPGARSGARDRLAEIGRWFWKSKGGRWLTEMSGWRLTRQSAPDQLVHRPTEVALGQAAEALFRALPPVQRRDLKQLPEQITFLATEAGRMRARLEELDDLIAQAAPDSMFGDRPAGDGGAGELRAARDLWATRLRETVTLLESLRVGLLKLHAGSTVPETLTAELDAARELRARLLLLHDAQIEVNDSLRPRPPLSGNTPITLP